MAKRKAQHNRYLGFERVRSQSEFEHEKSKPTAKQKKFFRSLIIKCKANGLDCDTGRTHSRAEYSMAIDLLIKRLTEAGIPVSGNGKTSTIVLTHKSDARNNEFLTTERIVVEDCKDDNI